MAAAFLMTLFCASCLCGAVADRLACLITKQFVLFFFPAPANQFWLLSSRISTSVANIKNNIVDWDPICILSISFARRKYMVLLSRYGHKPRHCLSPVWSHVHTVPSELKETHCLHTCHPNFIVAAHWEASLTFSRLPVNDASSSPVSNQARNAAKRQARLSAPYLLVESYCRGNWWVTWPKGEHQLQGWESSTWEGLRKGFHHGCNNKCLVM